MMKLRQDLEDLIATLFNRTKKWLITRFPIAQNAKKRYNQKLNYFITGHYNYIPINSRPKLIKAQPTS